MNEEKNAIKPTGRDEMNLAVLPFTRLGDKDKRTKIEYKGTTMEGGVQVEFQWTVYAGADKLPSEFDGRVMIALLAIAAEDDFKHQTMEFTYYQIIKILGINKCQRNYKKVESAITALVAVTVNSKKAWFDHEKKSRITTGNVFHLIDDATFYHEEDNTTGKSTIIWGKRLWQSMQSGYIKYLDLDFYFSLDNPITRQLYRFLDKMMAYQDEYQIDIFQLQQKLGMLPTTLTAQLKRKLAKAGDELVAEGYLGSFEFIKYGKFHRIKFLKPTAVLQNELQAKLFEDEDDDFDLELTSEEQGIDWKSVLVQLKMRNPQFAGALKRTGLISFEDGVLTIDGGLYAKKLSGWVNDGTLACCLTGIMGHEVVEVAVVDGSHEKVDGHGQSPSVV